MRKNFANWAKDRLSISDRLIVLLGDISVGLFVDSAERLPPRCYNVGILEQSMVSLAAGLSHSGFDVIVHTISPFMIERAFEQIKLDVSYNQNKVIFVAANGPFEYSKLGPTHHCPSDVPIFLHLNNNFQVRLPIREADVTRHLEECVSHTTSSVYVRLTNTTEVNGLPPNLRFNEITAVPYTDETIRPVSLTISVGEASYLLQTRDAIESSSHYLIVDRLPLDIALKRQIIQFKKITIFEPYSTPVVANALHALMHGLQILSFCYPHSIEDGVFNQVPFISRPIR
jgi:deoxyxylulose-5-phosphate synthase